MYYLDIETTGLEPRRDQILTIQYRPVARGGRPGGPLVILKAWESSEAEILKQFAATPFFDRLDPWAFFPTGFNLGFEYRFLQTRMRHHKIDLRLPWDWAFNKPSLDLHPVAVLMNGGRYKGSSLENFSRKATSGHSVIDSVARQDWPAVEAYVVAETDAFFELLQHLHLAMPRFWDEKVRPLVQADLKGHTTLTSENV